MTCNADHLADAERVVDTSGKQCPYPVVAARRALADMQPGERLLLISTDRHTALDLEAFCARTGHELLAADVSHPPYRFALRAKPD